MQRLVALTLAAALAGCGGLSGADEFRQASPSRQKLAVEMPQSGQALTAEGYDTAEGALGQTAELYTLTYGVTTVVNGALFWVGALVEAIIKHPPTTLSQDEAVWGPHTEPLSPVTWKFTVNRDGDAFTYALEGRAKIDVGGPFVTVLSGRHVPGIEPAGSGEFTLDWDAAQTLPNKPKEIGSVRYEYERADSGDLTVSAAFRQVHDDETGQRIDVDYGYHQVAGADGAFDFVVFKDFENDGSAIERLAFRSRWQQTGAGRSDMRASGGDLQSTIEASECWDSNFLRVHYTDSVNWKPSEGEASSCVFADASYSE